MKHGQKTPADAAALLNEIRVLMELKGENPFKIRAYEKASRLVGAYNDLSERAREGTLTELDGIGKGIAEVLAEFFLNDNCLVRDELLASLPAGLSELVRIPGLGPKKARKIVEKLDIHSVGDLEYACRENRLIEVEGFGEKLQQKILKGIEILSSAEGQQRLDDALPVAKILGGALEKAINDERHPLGGRLRVAETGALRRRMEVLGALEFLIETPLGEKAAADIRAKAEHAARKLRLGLKIAVPVKLYYSHPNEFGFELARTTGSEQHWGAIGSPKSCSANTEDDFYKALGLPPFPPETRETGIEVALAKSTAGLSHLLKPDAVRGVFHVHTRWSDGTGSIEEMVCEARRLGLEYIGIADHSQAAYYARGLKPADLVAQKKEVTLIQEKFPDIRIFWGIESDILADGSLDYDDEILKRFDFIVASVHSRFNLDKKTMTARIIKAIRNPYCRFLGHMTGRLLLGRHGYELDVEEIIKEAAQHNVAIEINSHPQRLDIDWRHGDKLREHKTLVSINPDAHSIEGLGYYRFGVTVARKALLSATQVVNSRSRVEVEKWLRS